MDYEKDMESDDILFSTERNHDRLFQGKSFKNA